MMVTDEIEVEDKILGSGGFADIRRGRYGGHLVAVKTLRIAEQDSLPKIRKVGANSIFSAGWDAVLTIIQQFCKEVILWNVLSHPNILKLTGVQGDMEKGQFVTVSEWMAHGTIMQYIKSNSVNRLELVCDFIFPTTSFTKMRQQLHGAAQGLKYLHGANLTHGDLKGVSVTSSPDRFLFSTSHRRTSSCPTTSLLVPALRILAL